MNALSLDQQICFALYSASRSFTALYRELLAPLGVTYPQYLVLLVLWERSAGSTAAPMSIGALGERLQLDSGTLSPLVRRLESAGHVERVRSDDDERVVLVRLTAQGRALEGATAGIPDRICSATGLALTDISELRDQIAGLAKAVRSSTELAVG